ncbi:MAG: CsgG/HfaB family protein [Rhizomicrobium sp.]
MGKATKITALGPLVALLLSGCTGQDFLGKNGVNPLYSFPVTSNETPYSQCLEDLARVPGDHLPTFAVGEIDDKTGQVNYTSNGHQLTQGVTEMVISALGKTGKANLVERSDLRIPLAEVKLAEQGRLSRPLTAYTAIPASDFIVMGALTELNYNIVSGGASLAIEGIGGGAKMAVINVALDLRVVNSRNFAVSYITSLQKQIYGYEVDANVFRFFGNTLVEFDAGKIKNEPLQLGVRSVVEMAVYQIMTEFLHLPGEQKCALTQTDHMAKQLDRLATSSKGE